MRLLGALLYFANVVAYDALLYSNEAEMEKSGCVAAIRSKFPIAIPPPWIWRLNLLFLKTFFFRCMS